MFVCLFLVISTSKSLPPKYIQDYFVFWGSQSFNELNKPEMSLHLTPQLRSKVNLESSVGSLWTSVSSSMKCVRGGGGVNSLRKEVMRGADNKAPQKAIYSHHVTNNNTGNYDYDSH